MQLEALRDRVILKRVEKPDAESMFVTPQTAREKTTLCEVVGISEGYTTEFGVFLAPPVKVGDRVLIGKYTSSEHKVDGEDLLFVRFDELLAVERKLPEPDLPSAADLDAVAAEQAIADETKGE